MATREEKRDETPTRLIAPNGTTVSVSAYKVENLLRQGFTKPGTKASTAPAKKAASPKKSTAKKAPAKKAAPAKDPSEPDSSDD